EPQATGKLSLTTTITGTQATGLGLILDAAKSVALKDMVRNVVLTSRHSKPVNNFSRTHHSHRGSQEPTLLSMLPTMLRTGSSTVGLHTI
uniref:Uncharacterized protein n=1 Tax=Brassica oleracea var. oleracea TaxID=109376 RepID=A0A0D3AGY2_BRAOL